VEFLQWRFSVKNEGAVAGLHRTGLGNLDREGAVRQAMDSRNQV
jgi:hypothetical protein